MAKIYDCIIIGGGPSGLTAGNVLAANGVDFMVIEKGDFLYKRSQEYPKDVVTGIGGGGLYSDGKVSFYPSGSNLYKLRIDLLIKSYEELKNLMNIYSIQIPEFDISWTENDPVKVADELLQKSYESIVLTQDQLYKVGFYLYDQIGKDRFLIKHKVTSIVQEKNHYLINCTDTELTNDKVIKAKNIIFCGGKFGSLSFKSFLKPKDLIFKKFEFGIRIETNHENFDFKDFQQTDLKLLMPNKLLNGIEFRTFCFCRNGYIIHGEFEELHSFNGVSNQPQFNKTNFGINLRINDEKVFKALYEEILKLEKSQSVIKQPLKEFLSTKNSNWSEKIHNLFKNCLEDYFPMLSKTDAEVTGPSFEYFGYYPSLTNELRLNNQCFWVCGDATGDFRGLMPSLSSGYLAAFSLLEKEKKEKDLLYESVRLKVSSTKKQKTIFTAQSKKFFYCKDAVCEFIFNEGGIPVNPFQVFGYFLNDRVDRNLIRNGNNELISRCDELWVFGPIADGVFFEIARAHELKMPIRFFNVSALAHEIQEIYNLSDLVFEPEVHARIPKENLIKFIAQSNIEKEQNQLKLDFDGYKS